METISLKRNETRSLRGGISRIECVEGAIWLTGKDFGGDIVIRQGESYDIARLKKPCVQALRDCTIALHGLPKERPIPESMEPIPA